MRIVRINLFAADENMPPPSDLLTCRTRALYEDHHGWLRNLLVRRVGCSETAADLAHDTFVRVLGKSSLPAIDEPRAYLARIAHGLVVDHHRRRALERAWLETLAAMPRDTAPSPEDQAAIVDTLTRIDMLLDGLKPRLRRVLLLSRLEGLTYPVIARRLGVSLSTVEKDMASALKHCYRVLLG